MEQVPKEVQIMKTQRFWVNAVSLFIILFVIVLFETPVHAAPLAQGEDPQAQADALYDDGFSLFEAGDYEEALDRFEHALTIYRDIGNQIDEAITLDIMGAVYANMGEYEQALDYYQQSLNLSQEINYQEGEGRALNSIGVVYTDLGEYEQALNYFQESLAIAQEIGDRKGEGAMTSGIATIYYFQGQYEEALDYFQQSLRIAQEIGDRKGEERRLGNIGATYRSVGQYQQALKYLQEALAIARELDDPAGQGELLTGIGMVYMALDQYDQALQSYQQAFTIHQEIGYRMGEGAVLNSIGQVYLYLGQYEQALEYFQQSLDIAQEIGDQARKAINLTDMAEAYTNLGQYERALNHYQQALALLQEIGYRSAEATALNGIAMVYAELGQEEQALDFYRQALVILEETGDREGEGRALINIGRTYGYLEQYDLALDHLQRALAILKELGDRDAEGAALNVIGYVYERMDQNQQALEYDQQALAILQEIGRRTGEASTLNNIGFLFEKLGQYPEASDAYGQALDLVREMGDRSAEGTILTNLGSLHQRQNNAEEAIRHYQQAVEVIESIQGEIRVDELKASYAAQVTQQTGAYEYLTGLLWDTERFEEAFHYTERARARAFLDQLAGGTMDFRAGANADLLGREQALRGEIASLRTQLIALRNYPQSEWDTDVIAATQADLTDREADYAQLLIDIKLQSPEVAGLVSVDVAALADIQSLLDTNTTLIDYFVTEDRTLAFIITGDSFETVTVDVKVSDLKQAINSFRGFASLDDPYPTSLKQLYTWLISPLKQKLKTPLIGIIPHDELHYVPFAALTDGQHYLGEEYSLFTLPSASALRFIHEKRKSEANTILAFGNPTITEPGLAPLQFAEQEAETIAHLFGTQPYLRDAATENTLRARSASVGILHIAAHAQYNPSNPLFSVIFLTPDQPEDGRLEVNEIYGLDLTKATDLVVLSACETQMGAVSAGDEVVGMTRAFMYAGTPTVIASLWKVDDAATTFLMERFYTHLQEGIGKAQALRQAQSEVRARYPHPYYWAAFVLTGDAGEVAETKSVQSLISDSRMLWAAGIVGTICLLFLSLLALRRRGKVAG